MALAWQRKASAWLSARPMARFQVWRPKGGPAAVQRLDIQVAQALGRSSLGKGCTPAACPAGKSPTIPAVAPGVSARQGLAQTSARLRAFGGWGLVRWRKQQPGAGPLR